MFSTVKSYPAYLFSHVCLIAASPSVPLHVSNLRAGWVPSAPGTMPGRLVFNTQAGLDERLTGEARHLTSHCTWVLHYFFVAVIKMPWQKKQYREGKVYLADNHTGQWRLEQKTSRQSRGEGVTASVLRLPAVSSFFLYKIYARKSLDPEREVRFRTVCL